MYTNFSEEDMKGWMDMLSEPPKKGFFTKK